MLESSSASGMQTIKSGFSLWRLSFKSLWPVALFSALITLVYQRFLDSNPILSDLWNPSICYAAIFCLSQWLMIMLMHHKRTGQQTELRGAGGQCIATDADRRVVQGVEHIDHGMDRLSAVPLLGKFFAFFFCSSALLFVVLFSFLFYQFLKLKV